MDGLKLFWEGVPHFLIAYGEERGQLYMSFVKAQMYESLTQISGLTYFIKIFNLIFYRPNIHAHFAVYMPFAILMINAIKALHWCTKFICHSHWKSYCAFSCLVSPCRISCRRVAFRVVVSHFVSLVSHLVSFVSHFVSPCRISCRRVANCVVVSHLVSLVSFRRVVY